MTNAFRHMEDLQAEHAASTREGHAKLRELEAEALTYKSMYEAFLNRYVQTVQQQSFPVTDARVVTKPRPPLRPSSPDPLYTVLLSLAAGLGFGSFVSFALEHRRAVRASLGSIAREAELVSLSKSRIPQEVEEAILALAIERPALSDLRILNELRKRGLTVSSAGVRWVLQRHELETVNKRVRFKNIQKGLVLTEASLKRGAESKTEKEADPESASLANGKSSVRIAGADHDRAMADFNAIPANAFNGRGNTHAKKGAAEAEAKRKANEAEPERQARAAAEAEENRKAAAGSRDTAEVGS
jgi:hypothetical protein